MNLGWIRAGPEVLRQRPLAPLRYRTVRRITRSEKLPAIQTNQDGAEPMGTTENATSNKELR